VKAKAKTSKKRAEPDIPGVKKHLPVAEVLNQRAGVGTEARKGPKPTALDTSAADAMVARLTADEASGDKPEDRTQEHVEEEAIVDHPDVTADAGVGADADADTVLANMLSLPDPELKVPADADADADADPDPAPDVATDATADAELAVASTATEATSGTDTVLVEEEEMAPPKGTSAAVADAAYEAAVAAATDAPPAEIADAAYEAAVAAATNAANPSAVTSVGQVMGTALASSPTPADVAQAAATTSTFTSAPTPAPSHAPVGVAHDLNTCNTTMCDPGAGPQFYDDRCITGGGLGCVGQTGCRFCRMAGDALNKQMEYCPPCTCDGAHGDQIDGCQPVGTPPELVDGAPSPDDSASDTDSDPNAAAPDQDAPAPEAANSNSTEAIADSEAVVEYPPLNGVAWMLTALGKFEGCNARCERAAMRCSDEQWPTTFQVFITLNPKP
jgi:hypothetical protein